MKIIPFGNRTIFWHVMSNQMSIVDVSYAIQCRKRKSVRRELSLTVTPSLHTCLRSNFHILPMEEFVKVNINNVAIKILFSWNHFLQVSGSKDKMQCSSCWIAQWQCKLQFQLANEKYPNQARFCDCLNSNWPLCFNYGGKTLVSNALQSLDVASKFLSNACAMLLALLQTLLLSLDFPLIFRQTGGRTPPSMSWSEVVALLDLVRRWPILEQQAHYKLPTFSHATGMHAAQIS
jgi:hypothetical protein